MLLFILTCSSPSYALAFWYGVKLIMDDREDITAFYFFSERTIIRVIFPKFGHMTGYSGPRDYIGNL